MSAILVRKFLREDATTLGQIFHRAVNEGAKQHYSSAQRRAWSQCAPSGPDWEARLGDAETFVAERDGSLVGFMSLVIESSHLEFAYVAPEAMGAGVSNALYADLEFKARACGLSRLSTDASELARPFFLRQRWRLIERQEIVRHGVTLHNYRMEKVLIAENAA